MQAPSIAVAPLLGCVLLLGMATAEVPHHDGLAYADTQPSNDAAGWLTTPDLSTGRAHFSTCYADTDLTVTDDASTASITYDPADGNFTFDSPINAVATVQAPDFQTPDGNSLVDHLKTLDCWVRVFIIALVLNLYSMYRTHRDDILDCLHREYKNWKLR